MKDEWGGFDLWLSLFRRIYGVTEETLQRVNLQLSLRDKESKFVSSMLTAEISNFKTTGQSYVRSMLGRQRHHCAMDWHLFCRTNRPAAIYKRRGAVSDPYLGCSRDSVLIFCWLIFRCETVHLNTVVGLTE